MTDPAINHMTLGELRALIAAHADKPDAMQVRLVMDHGMSQDTTYARRDSEIYVVEADPEDGRPECLALVILDLGPIDLIEARRFGDWDSSIR
jgi:hypothetical protein